jgi:hypothetical protein
VPLVLGEQPAVALTWAHEATARGVAAAGEAALVLSEPRAGRPRVGAAGAARARDGWSRTATAACSGPQLLEQEVASTPPSRALADSPLVRREHWW